jgi:hypothetical protein
MEGNAANRFGVFRGAGSEIMVDALVAASTQHKQPAAQPKAERELVPFEFGSDAAPLDAPLAPAPAAKEAPAKCVRRAGRRARAARRAPDIAGLPQVPQPAAQGGARRAAAAAGRGRRGREQTREEGQAGAWRARARAAPRRAGEPSRRGVAPRPPR